MEHTIELIIFHLIFLHFLCLPKTSNAESCQTMGCNGNKSRSSFPINFPFRLVDHQAKSCGSPGFDVYCDNKLDYLLQLPNAGNFTVDAIYYSVRQIKLSKPNNCLPQKLLSLDLTQTPFRGISLSKDFWVYNCTGVGDHNDLYDEIDCLRGSNYTVVSVQPGVSVTNSDCRLLKIVSVPTHDSHNKLNSTDLSSYSSIYLTWDEQNCESCGESFTWTSPTASDSNIYSSEHRTLVAVVTTFVVLVLIGVSYILYALMSRKNVERSAVTITDTDTTVSQGQSSASFDVTGLDQTTINSYPTVVIGESRRQIKSDDDKCPICLMAYFPGDTLKMLPECLHRYHAECIDPWLGARATCPICRTSPSSYS